MATILSASIYGLNSQSMGTGTQGVTMGFPTSAILIRPAPAGTVYNTVTMATIIQLLPMGTKVAEDQFYTATALATVITSANS
jgi:hypothetical protein